MSSSSKTKNHTGNPLATVFGTLMGAAYTAGIESAVRDDVRKAKAAATKEEEDAKLATIAAKKDAAYSKTWFAPPAKDQAQDKAQDQNHEVTTKKLKSVSSAETALANEEGTEQGSTNKNKKIAAAAVVSETKKEEEEDDPSNFASAATSHPPSPVFSSPSSPKKTEDELEEEGENRTSPFFSFSPEEKMELLHDVTEQVQTSMKRYKSKIQSFLIGFIVVPYVIIVGVLLMKKVQSLSSLSSSSSASTSSVVTTTVSTAVLLGSGGVVYYLYRSTNTADKKKAPSSSISVRLETCTGTNTTTGITTIQDFCTVLKNIKNTGRKNPTSTSTTTKCIDDTVDTDTDSEGNKDDDDDDDEAIPQLLPAFSKVSLPYPFTVSAPVPVPAQNDDVCVLAAAPVVAPVGPEPQEEQQQGENPAPVARPGDPFPELLQQQPPLQPQEQHNIADHAFVKCNSVHPCRNCIRRRLQQKQEDKRQALIDEQLRIAKEEEDAKKAKEFNFMDMFLSFAEIDPEKLEDDPYVIAAQKEKREKEQLGGGDGDNENDGDDSNNQEKKEKDTLTEQQLEHVNTRVELLGYTKSSYFFIGYRAFYNKEFQTKRRSQELAFDAFRKGSEQHGCVPCIFYYIHMLLERNLPHLALPWIIEGAIRGHRLCMNRLIAAIYNKAQPEQVDVLTDFWVKILLSFNSTYITQETRDNVKLIHRNRCFVCRKKQLDDEENGNENENENKNDQQKDENKKKVDDDGKKQHDDTEDDKQAADCDATTSNTTTTTTTTTTSTDPHSQNVKLVPGIEVITSEAKVEDIVLERCGVCKYYSYCSRDCQVDHWHKCHMGQCRQIKKLRKYYKPYSKKIRKSLMNGEDPASIKELQVLRQKLGLTRPISEGYQTKLDLIQAQTFTVDMVQEMKKANPCNNHEYKNPFDPSDVPNRYEYIVARKDGSLHFGSTPNVI